MVNSYICSIEICSTEICRDCGFYLWYTESGGSNNQSYKVLNVFTDITEKRDVTYLIHFKYCVKGLAPTSRTLAEMTAL